MGDLILSKLAPFSGRPHTLVLSKFIPPVAETELTGQVFWRFADETGDDFRLLGKVSPSKKLEVPLDLKGKEIILSLVTNQGEILELSDPRQGVQANFVPNPKGELEAELVIASEYLSAGDLINFWNDTGTAKARKADAQNGYEAHAYVLQDVTSGNTVYALFGGINDRVSGLTPGIAYLSTTAGAATSTAPSGSGEIVQQIGVAVAADKIYFEPQPPIELV